MSIDFENHLAVTDFMKSLFSNNELTYEEIVGNVLTILNGSVTTTASTQVFALLLLAMHENIQANLFQEINQLWDDKIDGLPLESLKRAYLLDRVVKETLRLFPSVPSVVRKADKKIKLDEKYTIPKGTFVITDIFNLQRDSRIWEHSLEFDPDRFLPERFSERHRGAFLPFWFFSRNCIGQYFSLLSVKLGIAHVVKHFRITNCNYKHVSDINLRTSTFIEPKENCHLEFKIRNKL